MDLKIISRETLYTGRIIDLVVDRISYPSGREGVREVARHPGGAVTVPLLDNGNVLLVRQFRYPLGKYITELPAGKLAPGEDPAVAAARELAEETGFAAKMLEHLTTMYSTPGFCDEELHIYLARGLKPVPGGPRREEGESTMTVEEVPLAEAVERVVRGELQDAKTIVGLLLTSRLLSPR